MKNLIFALALFGTTQALAAEEFLVYCHTRGVADAGKVARVMKTGTAGYTITVGDIWFGGEKNLVTEAARRTSSRSNDWYSSDNFRLQVGAPNRAGERYGRLTTDRKSSQIERHMMSCSTEN